MTTTVTSVYAHEESTFVINLAFTDEDDNAVTPNEISWSLTDDDGNFINSRNAVSETPDTSIDIVLSGDDLALQSGESGKVRRHLVIEGTYDSDAGSDLPLRDDCIFAIEEDIL